ncbi:hypothetical protein M405DRAFT_813211 [Rhizopogon salebrosus TDB-379]|nr:hypothetical protein M405DRAFT_813211 [Rhizopogon salebrosus TDB-379]
MEKSRAYSCGISEFADSRVEDIVNSSPTPDEPMNSNSSKVGERLPNSDGGDDPWLRFAALGKQR